MMLVTLGPFLKNRICPRFEISTPVWDGGVRGVVVSRAEVRGGVKGAGRCVW